MAKLIYKPFGILCGMIAGVVSKKLFNAIWSRIDSHEPPRAHHEQVPLAKVIGATALEAVVFQSTRVAVDRAGARAFANLTGVWPGEHAPEASDA